MHQYFLHNGTAMTLFNWPYQSDGWSIAWEMLSQFFHNKIYNPPAFDMIYLHKYSHGFPNYTDVQIQILLKNINSNCGNTSP